MIFNIASASLTIKAYNRNSTDSYITHTEYALCITELFFICLGIFFLINNKKNMIISFCLLTVECFNIAYSVIIIDSYKNNDIINVMIDNMSIAIVALNVLSLFGFVGKHIEVLEK